MDNIRKLEVTYTNWILTNSDDMKRRPSRKSFKASLLATGQQKEEIGKLVTLRAKSSVEHKGSSELEGKSYLIQNNTEEALLPVNLFFNNIDNERQRKEQ